MSSSPLPFLLATTKCPALPLLGVVGHPTPPALHSCCCRFIPVSQNHLFLPFPFFPSLLPSGTVSLQEDVSQAQSPVREQQQAAARLQPQPTSSSLPACPKPVQPALAACSNSPQKCSFSQIAARKQARPWGESLWHGTYWATHTIGTGLCWLAPSPLSSGRWFSVEEPLLFPPAALARAKHSGFGARTEEQGLVG